MEVDKNEGSDDDSSDEEDGSEPVRPSVHGMFWEYSLHVERYGNIHSLNVGSFWYIHSR